MFKGKINHLVVRNMYNTKRYNLNLERINLKKVEKIDNDYIEYLLNKLIDEYYINENILSNFCGVGIGKIREYKKYENEFIEDIDVCSKKINVALQL